MTKSQVTFHTGHATRRPEPIAGPSAPPLSRARDCRIRVPVLLLARTAVPNRYAKRKIAAAVRCAAVWRAGEAEAGGCAAAGWRSGVASRFAELGAWVSQRHWRDERSVCCACSGSGRHRAPRAERLP